MHLLKQRSKPTGPRKQRITHGIYMTEKTQLVKLKQREPPTEAVVDEASQVIMPSTMSKSKRHKGNSRERSPMQ